ncbi:MAG: hypothetical protein V2I74_02180 [Erythrobacter sp.]|jgi:hypothetical protein|nr:hypothetical protein [Erythrobacter sp.]
MNETSLSSPAGNRTFRLLFVAMAAMILALPAVAMQFSGEVNWGPGDFLVAGGLLALLGLGIDGVLRWRTTRLLRAATIGLTLLAFLLIWAELAVGIFD